MYNPADDVYTYTSRYSDQMTAAYRYQGTQ